MEREIKFRAWDKTNKKMIKLFGIFGHTGSLLEWKGGWKFYHKNRANNLIVMQYTGLKDKNGKDIYEGDIVKRYCPCGKCNSFWKGEIIYLDRTACFAFRDYKNRTDSQLIMYDEHGAGKIAPLEVIGNVFENPELIKNV